MRRRPTPSSPRWRNIFHDRGRTDVLSRIPPLGLVLAIGLFWGLNWPSVKFILSEVPPWTLRGAGLGLGAVLLVGYCLASSIRLRPDRGDVGMLALTGLLSVFGFNIFVAFGQLNTATSTAAIIAFTMPIWAALMSGLILGERISRRTVLALIFGMTGLGVLIGGDFAAFIANPIGPLYVLGGAISWAAGTVALKSRPWSLPPVSRAAWMVGISAAPTILTACIVESPWRTTPPSNPVLLVFAYHVVFPMVLCHAAWVSLVHQLPTSIAAIGTLMVPVVGVLSASLLLGESLTAPRIMALTLVLASIALTFVRSRAIR